MIEERDLEQEALDRVITQYRDSPKLLAMISAVVAGSSEVQAAAFALMAKLNLDNATGVWLDILGRIVGLPRPLIAAEAFEYFAFVGAAGAQSFGDLDTPEVGGRFGSVFESTTGQTKLADGDYRILIRAKVLKNHGDATPEHALAVIRAAFPDVSPVSITEGPTAEVRIVFGRLLSTIEKGLLSYTDLIPVPTSVEASLIESEGEDAFGFAGSVGTGFGNGAFASIFG